MRGTGRRRAGEDNVRLRLKLDSARDDLAWYRLRLRAVTAKCRAATAQAEIVGGELLLAQQLVARQTTQLMALDSENENLRRQLKAAADDTVETPIPAAIQLAAA